MMKEMTARLADDPHWGGYLARRAELVFELAARYQRASDDYVSRRDELGVLEKVPAQGGMPTRVKCLHVLVAHSLAAGPGVNPFGDEALEQLPEWWSRGPCVAPPSGTPADPDPS